MIVAATRIKHNGETFEPGESLGSLPDDLINHFLEIGSAENLPNIEPSVRDSEGRWRQFMVEQGQLTEEEASEMSKDELISFWIGEEEPEVDDSPEGSEEDPEPAEGEGETEEE